MSPRLSIATLAILWLVSTVIAVMSILSFPCLSSRFLPKNPHPMTVYVRPGVEVDKKRSNEKSVTLRNLQQKTTGRYRCEVSTEGPTFATESKYGDLLVVGKNIWDTLTVFENYRKSLIWHCEQSELRLYFGQKFIKNAKNGQFWRYFENLKLAVNQCYQDKNWWKMPKFKCDILSNFQTLWGWRKWASSFHIQKFWRVTV